MWWLFHFLFFSHLIQQSSSRPLSSALNAASLDIKATPHLAPRATPEYFDVRLGGNDNPQDMSSEDQASINLALQNAIALARRARQVSPGDALFLRFFGDTMVYDAVMSKYYSHLTLSMA
jgi:hypothetical protein